MKEYDLEERTYQFARTVRVFTRNIPRTLENTEDAKQLIRASGSAGANYIEANESLSKKDFIVRIKISRKEAKESRLFLRLIDPGDESESRDLQCQLIQEARELTNIFGAILRKSQT